MAARGGCRAAARPDAHLGSAAPAPGHRRDRHTPAAAAAGLAHQGRHHRDAPLAGVLAAGRLPLPGRPRARRGGDRRHRRLGGRRPLRVRVPVRVALVAGQRTAPRHGRRHEQQPATAPFRRGPGRRRTDSRRHRGLACGPVAHLGRRLARRAGLLGAARAEPRRGAAAPGGAPDSDQGRRRRRRGRRAPPAGAGPARRHPAAARLAGDEPGHGQGTGQHRGRGAGRRRGSPRGGEGRARRAAGPDPRAAPGRARGPGARRGAVRRGGADADRGPADRAPAAPPVAGGRGRRLLRSVRGPGQHRQARPGVPGGGVRATHRRQAARHRHRRRRGRRRPGPRHRPDGPGQARPVGGRDLRGRQPARRADRAFRGPAMRQVTAAPGTRGTGARGTGRWIWGVSGLVTIVALAVPGAHLILNAGTPSAQGDIAAIPTRTIAITQPVTSLNVQSYGAPIQIATGSGPHVTVAEAISFSGDTSPAVTAQVTGGQLTLAAPACAQSDCSVGFTVTLPTGVPVTAASSGGDIIISGAAGASLDSGGGAVRATDITGSLGITSEGGPVLLGSVAGANVDSGGGVVQAAKIYGQLTVTTESGPLTVSGLTGALHADTGGGNLVAEGISASTASVTTESGDARLGFATAPDSVQVDTGGGTADLSVPGGPYALTANDGGGGPELISIATNPAATRSIIVSTNGGPLRIDAGAVGGQKIRGKTATGGPPNLPNPPNPPRPPAPPKP